VAKQIVGEEAFEESLQVREEDYDSSSPSRSSLNDITSFLAVKKAPASKRPSSSKSSPRKSQRPPSRPQNDFPEELQDHLALLSLLDQEVGDVFSQAQDIFNDDRRKGPRRRPSQADPRRLED